MKINTLNWVLLFFCLPVFSKSQTLSGTIVNLEGERLSDILLIQKDKGIHSHSDLNGQFFLSGLEVGDTIEVSALGYESQKYIFNSQDFTYPFLLELKASTYQLKQVSVKSTELATRQMMKMDISRIPVSNSQELLQKIPGLFIAQHAGGGKAEQIFLRGYDIDHGTDIALQVDGMPVNMVSHAHGQGYSDLHFIIPETIDYIDFGKGPHATEQGNLATAGYVQYHTKDKIDNSSIGIELGRFDYKRLSAMLKLTNANSPTQAYLASEALYNDGPFESPQGLRRYNTFGKLKTSLNDKDELVLSLSYFKSTWNASGQIPQRLVNQGTISRFGAVDDTEGGTTGRLSLSAGYTCKIANQAFLKTNLSLAQYDFELYSNFTFFLDDPINGDQIRQKENRGLLYLQSTLYQQISQYTNLQIGLGARVDQIKNNELSKSLNRKTTRERIALGDIDEYNTSGFVELEWSKNKWQINPGLRLDGFAFQYLDQLSETTDILRNEAFQFSPKLSISYQAKPNVGLFLKASQGFHSNDTRLVTGLRRSENPVAGVVGLDVGTIWQIKESLILKAALWHLDSEQELVYVGDAGIVELSDRALRTGFDVGIRYQPTQKVYVFGNINYANARYPELPRGKNFVPLAPNWTSMGGFNYEHRNISLGLNYRYINQRPAVEDKSIRAEGYFIMDAFANLALKNITIGLSIENILNQEWNEAQFATESRLFDEQTPVEEIHFTPGNPFFSRIRIAYTF